METGEVLQMLVDAFSDRQLFLVGGCLRDELLGRPASDLDLATDARPDDIQRRVSAWADAIWLAGERFGTVGLLKGGVKAEITTFRSEAYDGISRKPDVAFGHDIRDDLARRDVTINAIARDLHTGELLDPFDGRQDLADHLIRFVGSPEERIREDPLRMLRAVRFCAHLGFELDPTAAASIAAAADEITRISWERIRNEFDGIILSPNPDRGLRLAIDLGLARHIMPELLRLHLPEPYRHHMKDLLDHTLDTVRLIAPDKALRYAALLHDIAKPETFSADDSGVHFYRHERSGTDQAAAALARLRQPSSLIRRVEDLIHNHMRIPYYRPEWTDGAIRRLMYRLGGQLEAAFALAEADVRASDPVDLPAFEERLRHLRERVRKLGQEADVARMKPLISGNDVMSILGIGPGPFVGEVLRYLLDEQLEGRITTREQADAAVRSKFARR